MTKLRWGILGAAGIARKNWKAIRDSGNGVLTAVASRDIQRTRKFISECQEADPYQTAPGAYGGYEELLASPEVDAVYIPLPTGLRKEWVVRAAQAGKHVLCEKPCASSLADLQEMTAACRRHRVQFMDGVMFMHNTRLERLRVALQDPKGLGQLRRMTTQFSFLASEGFLDSNIRADHALEPLGCVGDLGWYCVRFALWLMNWQMPLEVSGRILSEFAGPQSAALVPSEFAGELRFEGGVSVGFYCSFITGFRQWVDISGTQGALQIPDFVLPADQGDLDFEVNGIKQVRPQIAPAEMQHVGMFRAFNQQVHSGELNELWPEMALKTQTVVNACLDQARRGGRG
jgi:predicted dehydrogenase